MGDRKYLDYTGLQELVAKIDENYAPVQALVFKGTVATISGLPTVSGQKEGYMYNITTGGTTTADFVEGAGKDLRDGSNVAAINTGTDADPVMKWDILPGVFNIDDRLQFGNSFPASPENGQTFLYMGSTTYTYTAVTPEGSEDPATLGWYHSTDGGTTWTAATEHTPDTTTYQYATRAEKYIHGVIYVYSTALTDWVPQSTGDTMVAITNGEIDALFA